VRTTGPKGFLTGRIISLVLIKLLSHFDVIFACMFATVCC